VHADKVVSVHDRVDEAVQQNGKKDVAVEVDVNVDPVKEKDGSVVVHVEERELVPLLSNDDEDSVPKVPYFGEVEHIHEIHQRWIFSVVIVTVRVKGVVVTVRDQECFDGHVGTEHDLGHVVNKFERVGIHGW